LEENLMSNPILAAVTAIPKIAASTASGAVGNTVIRALNGLDDSYFFGYDYNPIADSARPWFKLDQPHKKAAFVVGKTIYTAVHVPQSLVEGCLRGASRGFTEGVLSVAQDRMPNLTAGFDFLLPRSSPWMPELMAYNCRWF
jgi:hypothetical protein